MGIITNCPECDAISFPNSAGDFFECPECFHTWPVRGVHRQRKFRKEEEIRNKTKKRISKEDLTFD